MAFPQGLPLSMYVREFEGFEQQGKAALGLIEITELAGKS